MNQVNSTSLDPILFKDLRMMGEIGKREIADSQNDSHEEVEVHEDNAAPAEAEVFDEIGWFGKKE